VCWWWPTSTRQPFLTGCKHSCFDAGGSVALQPHLAHLPFPQIACWAHQMLTFCCCCCCSLPLSGATINVIVDDDKSIKDGSVIVVPGHKEKHNTVINVPGHGKVRNHNINSKLQQPLFLACPLAYFRTKTVVRWVSVPRCPANPFPPEFAAHRYRYIIVDTDARQIDNLYLHRTSPRSRPSL
jgi:hypothetical protein